MYFWVGYIIILNITYVLRVGLRQTYISLYSLYYEYAVLSHSVKDLLPLESIIKEVIDNLGIDSEKLKFVSSSTIYEDNNGAIVVAKIPRMVLTSNCIDSKYHCFGNHVGK